MARSRAAGIISRMVDKYGLAKTTEFIRCLRANESYTAAGAVLGLSRQRAEQLAKGLGQRQTTYLVHSEIRRIANSKEST